MRKKIIASVQQQPASLDQEWLNLDGLVELEITSEDTAHPIEAALLPGGTSGWRAAGPGKQRIRLRFIHPQRICRILLKFSGDHTERTQEYLLRWSADGGQTYRDLVRQQWNFSPTGSNAQTEDQQVDLAEVTVLELNIIPNISGGDAIASLEMLRLA